MGDVIALQPKDRRPRRPRGKLYILPSMTNGGSWDIVHEPVTGDPVVVANRFSYDDALSLIPALVFTHAATFIDGEGGAA